MNNSYKINKELNNYNNKKLDAIRKIYIGSATFLATAPICIYNIDIEDFPIIAMTILEIGVIAIPIIGIKNIITSSRNIKLIRTKIEKDSLYNPKEIEQAYEIVRYNLDKEIDGEERKGKRKKLIKLRNDISKYSAT